MSTSTGSADSSALESEPLLSSRSTSNNSLSSPQSKPSRQIEDDTIPETSTLGRNLSWSSAYILVISRVIGSGIFATPGPILKTTGSIGLALLLWVAGSILAWLGLQISLEYGCMLPRSGGEKVYLEFTYPKPRFLASTLVAVQAVLLGFTASNCIVFGEYVLFALGIEGTELGQKAIALGLLTWITIIHGCFLKTGIWIQNFLGWIKVGLILFMALTGIFVVIFGVKLPGTGAPIPTLSREGFSWDRLWTGSNWHWGTLTTAVFKVSYSYAGLSNLNNVLNEVKDPVRTLRTVAPAALFTACSLYLLANFAYLSVVPLEEVKESGQLIAALFFERIFGDVGGRILLPLAVAVSAAGNVMVVTFTLARVNQEIARQGFLPYSKHLSSSAPFGAPFGGLIVHYIPSFLVIAIPPRGDVYNFILDVEGYPGQFAALALSLGLIRLRYSRPDLKRPFKAWLPAVWIRIAICLALIAGPFFKPTKGNADVGFWYATYAVVGVGIILFGVGWWAVVFWGLPRWSGYKVEEEVEILEDGTSVTRLVRVKGEE
ncbi:Bcmup3 [Botrytis cinerea B05.10]|uniref:Bcmup3 n=2 Tax=Botryotinia fuckeliana TaxID=40559 RepID=A0A384JFY6_BOTFB|nr:Bcmup3 [Botrytis cinerea B05.10]ATZ49523.1 Bcmup3 [Botrytis cinerea B05.10]EMR88664.1 putative methionine protein [Botrytis cinerea BcDW1]